MSAEKAKVHAFKTKAHEFVETHRAILAFRPIMGVPTPSPKGGLGATRDYNPTTAPKPGKFEKHKLWKRPYP